MDIFEKSVSSQMENGVKFEISSRDRTKGNIRALDGY